MSILIADDELRVRSALRLAIEQEHGMCLCGEAANSREVLPGVARIKPDILLLDWEMTPAENAGLIAGARRIRPDVKVVALSGLPASRAAAMKAGADYFICKNDATEGLLTILRNIFRNKFQN